jgi:hypothetical protein
MWAAADGAAWRKGGGAKHGSKRESRRVAGVTKRRVAATGAGGARHGAGSRSSLHRGARAALRRVWRHHRGITRASAPRQRAGVLSPWRRSRISAALAARRRGGATRGGGWQQHGGGGVGEIVCGGVAAAKETSAWRK